MEDIKYPIGRFLLKQSYTNKEVESMVQTIEKYPDEYRKVVSRLDTEELGKTYREGGWNVAQIVHHVADAQLLHYFRMKKAITETNYKEATLMDMDQWAKLPDANIHLVEDSLAIFSGIHSRFAQMIRNLSPEQLAISYVHPVRKAYFDQKNAIALAAWHVKHHLAHIKMALSTN